MVAQSTKVFGADRHPGPLIEKASLSRPTLGVSPEGKVEGVFGVGDTEVGGRSAEGISSRNGVSRSDNIPKTMSVSVTEFSFFAKEFDMSLGIAVATATEFVVTESLVDDEGK